MGLNVCMHVKKCNVKNVLKKMNVKKAKDVNAKNLK